MIHKTAERTAFEVLRLLGRPRFFEISPGAPSARNAFNNRHTWRSLRPRSWMALAGDGTALRLCLDRIIPPRRERPVRFKMPVLQSPADAVAAMAAIAAAVAEGYLTPGEASELSNMVGNYIKSLEAAEFDERLRALEAKGFATRP